MLKKKDFESNVNRTAKLLSKKGMDEFGTCFIPMSKDLIEEMLSTPSKKSKGYLYHLNVKLRSLRWKDDECYRYLKINDFYQSHDNANEMVFELDEDYYYI